MYRFVHWGFLDIRYVNIVFSCEVYNWNAKNYNRPTWEISSCLPRFSTVGDRRYPADEMSGFRPSTRQCRGNRVRDHTLSIRRLLASSQAAETGKYQLNIASFSHIHETGSVYSNRTWMVLVLSSLRFRTAARFTNSSGFPAEPKVGFSAKYTNCSAIASCQALSAASGSHIA